ncbi:MAG: hypothetical protein NC416_01510 [Eubacterium sp.]|nr:hypothetical protein [Eubacterium sp.]
MEELLKELKVKSVRGVIWIVALTTLVAVVLFAFNGHAILQIFDMLEGGTCLDDIPNDKLDNTIANSEIYAVYDCFAEYEASNGHLYEYYIVPYGVDGEKYIGVRVSEERASQFDGICDDTWAFLMGEGDTLDSTAAVKGNVRPMDSDEASYYKNWFEEMDFSSDEIDEYVVNYVLVDNTFADDISPLRLYLMSGCGILVFFIGVFVLIKACTGGYLKEIKRDFAQLDAHAESQIVSDYQNACTLNKSIRVGHLFTYDVARSVPRAYRNSNIAWLYQHRTKHYTNGLYTGSHYSIIFYPANGTGKTGDGFESKKKDCGRILEYYANNFPHMVVGYSEELRDLYSRDRNAFLALRYLPAQQAQGSDIFNRNGCLDQQYSNPA